MCSICLNDDNNNDMVKLPCGHEFHNTCIKSWSHIKNTCPNCRKVFNRNMFRNDIYNDDINNNTFVDNFVNTPRNRKIREYYIRMNRISKLFEKLAELQNNN
jgi:hypothetical protein